MIEKINDNAYKLDLPSEYQVSATFNVTGISLFGVNHEFDSRKNHFEKEEKDGKHDRSNNLKEPWQGI